MYEILNIRDFSHVSLFSYFCNPKKAGAGGGGGGRVFQTYVSYKGGWSLNFLLLLILSFWYDITFEVTFFLKILLKFPKLFIRYEDFLHQI